MIWLCFLNELLTSLYAVEVIGIWNDSFISLICYAYDSTCYVFVDRSMRVLSYEH